MRYELIQEASDKLLKVYEKPGVGKVALAVAKKPDKNRIVETEYRTLKSISKLANPPRVVPLYSHLFTLRSPAAGPDEDQGYEADTEDNEAEAPTHYAYIMAWITGCHSKTQKPRFERQLLQWAKTPACPQFRNAQADLQCLDQFCRNERSIGDLQVMLEERTGHLFLIDPTGLTDCKREGHPLVKRWLKILAGEIRNIPNDPGYKKAD